MSEIAIMLNSSEIPTKRGGFWAKKTISAILKNSVHCGYHRFEKKISKKQSFKNYWYGYIPQSSKLNCWKDGRPKSYDFDKK